MDYCLESTGLQKQYGHFRALDGLDIHVPAGAIYGLVGKNGAGKTTLIRIISGLQEPTGGEYRLYGTPCTDKRINRARRRMGAVVETPSVYLDMSARDNLRQQYRVLGMPDFKGIDELLSLVGLADTGRKKARNFSLGMKQRLGIAVSLCGNPDFLVLDEPINGLDPEGIVEMRELILRLNREKGITFLVSSHILDELSRLATHYGFIDRGVMLRELSAQELTAHERKCVRVNVTDLGALCRVLDNMGLEYGVVSNSECDVFGEIRITPFTLALAKENCEVLSIHERNENLESFYMNLVGGGDNA